MASLPSGLRKQFEKTIIVARRAAETAGAAKSATAVSIPRS